MSESTDIVTNVFFAESPTVALDSGMINRLKTAAQQSPLRRARFCLHQTPEDPLQEMIIVHHCEFLDPPHRHSGKTLSILVIDGALTIAMFDLNGNVTKTVQLSPPSQDGAFVYRIGAGEYFSLLPETEFAVIHEVLTGPHQKTDGFYPPWAPSQDDELRTFLRKIVR